MWHEAGMAPATAPILVKRYNENFVPLLATPAVERSTVRSEVIMMDSKRRVTVPGGYRDV